MLRFVIGPIPPSETLDPKDSGWTPMVSSHELPWARFLSLAGMLLLLVAGFLALQQAALADDVNPWLLVSVIAATLLLVPCHELSHCIGYFVPIRSRRLVTGICPELGAWYAPDPALR